MSCKLHLFLTALGLVFILIAAAPVRAEGKNSEFTIPELTGFAFYKLAKADPDLESWVKNSPRYVAAHPREKYDLLKADLNRLRNGFDGYTPKDYPIELSAKAYIKLPTAGIGKNLIAKHGHVPLPLTLTDDNGSYFAIPVDNLWIALIPQNLEDFLEIQLTPEEFERMLVKFKENQIPAKGTVIISMDMTPFQVDIERPIHIDQYDLWMMMAEISSFEVWSDNKEHLLWSYRQDGYVSQNEQSISNLFGN